MSEKQRERELDLIKSRQKTQQKKNNPTARISNSGELKHNTPTTKCFKNRGEYAQACAVEMWNNKDIG